MSERSLTQVVICAGSRVMPECAQAMESFQNEGRQKAPRFLMSEWCSKDQLLGAALLWIVDSSEPWVTMLFALRNQIPFLVSEENYVVKRLCVGAGCGVSFRGAPEARFCLDLLLADEALRRQMGANGRAYIER